MSPFCFLILKCSSPSRLCCLHRSYSYSYPSILAPWSSFTCPLFSGQTYKDLLRCFCISNRIALSSIAVGVVKAPSVMYALLSQLSNCLPCFPVNSPVICLRAEELRQRAQNSCVFFILLHKVFLQCSLRNGLPDVEAWALFLALTCWVN